MATWLNEYKELKGGIAQQANGGQMALEQLMLHQELLYRIEVLEACQTLCKTALITTDLQAMSGHYKLVDAYICCMAKERRFGQPADDNLKAKRKTAAEALEKTVADCRKRFSSFAPAAPEHYGKSISALISTVLPVWLQLRNTYINITK